MLASRAEARTGTLDRIVALTFKRVGRIMTGPGFPLPPEEGSAGEVVSNPAMPKGTVASRKQCAFRMLFRLQSRRDRPMRTSSDNAQTQSANNAIRPTVRLININGAPPSLDCAHRFDWKIDLMFTMMVLHISQAWLCPIFGQDSLSATVV